MLIGLMIDIMQRGESIPIVRHTFFGHSREEVSGKLARHIDQDRFLSDAWSGELEGIDVVYKWGSKEG